jgi:CheY-like chemotaxis protein
MVSRAGETVRVLIVDDDDLVRSVVHTALVQSGYAVRDAQNSAEAVRLLLLQRVELVILDAHMDGSTLAEDLARIRALPGGDELAIIVLSGASVDPALLEQHAASYLAKPVDFPVFIAAIATAVGDRQ